MKKICLFLICLIFLNVFLTEQSLGFLDIKKSSRVFSDPDFQNPTHNFSPGQMVYIKIEHSGNGEKQRLLKLLDKDKKEVALFTLNRSGNDPFIYTTSFKAPDGPGVYYVDIKIEGGGSSFASQENINIGENEGSSSVISEVKSGVTDTLVPSRKPSLTIKPKISPTPSIEIPSSTPPVPKTEIDYSFVARIINFLKSFLVRLTNW